MKPTKTTIWKSQREGYLQALKYLQGRKDGTIRSFRTPWSKVNDAGIDGFEWHSLIILGGRSGTGKTLIKDQLVREAFKLNRGENMRILEFQFEMIAKVSKIREFSSVLGKSYKSICSAEDSQKLSQEDLSKCHAYAKQRVENPIDIVETPCDVVGFKKAVHDYMEMHSTTTENGTKLYQNTVITLDHSYLIKVGKGEKGKTDMLYNLGEAATELKRKYPVIIIILSQLKREVDSPERNEDGKYGNYILDSDIFGGDALYQHADIVIGINRPAQRFIKLYGPDRFIIEDESVLVFHFLKVRNGDTRMSFFRSKFDEMKIIEMPTPGIQEKRISTKN
jgi:replicative DNA helicase